MVGLKVHGNLNNQPFAQSGHMVQNKLCWDPTQLHSETFKVKESWAGLVQVPLFWKSHCVTCIPVELIPYQVTGSCKRLFIPEMSTTVYANSEVLKVSNQLYLIVNIVSC